MTMTANPSTVVDSGGYSVRRTISIAAPLDKVWDAITRAEHIARRLPQRAELEPVAMGESADPAASMEDHRSGWDSELDELVVCLEGGS